MGKNKRIRVGLTMGDPSGIGPAIIAKTLGKFKGSADFTVIGDRWVFDRVSAAGGPARGWRNFRRRRTSPRLAEFPPQADQPAAGGVPGCKFIDLDNVAHNNFRFGEIKAEHGRASIEYLDKAIELIKKNRIDCLVTCPVSKEAINLGGLSGFSGHTEYLAGATNIKDFVMMLLNRQLKISLVTRHIPLRSVVSGLNKDKIYNAVSLTYKSLRELFSIRNPRIVVCGLNPHASDNGLIGKEEKRIIDPALTQLRRDFPRLCLDGPMSSDVAISKTARKEYDCAIAMYHDQALIPLKILADYRGVNVTLGLKFIRTSPLHGTAFDIAKNFNLANPASLIEAVRVAIRCALNQKRG